jgi:hypothetical protein
MRLVVWRKAHAPEFIALAKVATSNKLRANHYATADRYLRLAEAEPTMTNSDALSDHGQIPVASSDDLSTRHSLAKKWGAARNADGGTAG